MPDFTQIQHPVSSLRMLAKLRIAGAPDWVGIDPGAVWISNNAKNNITRIDAATNKVVTHVTVGRQPCAGLGVGFGSIWVPNCGDSTITRVDTISSRVTATIRAGVANSEGSIGVGSGGVWMPTDANGILSRIDPATNTIIARIHVREGSFAAAVGLGAVWVTSTTHHLVSRIDPSTNSVVAIIPVGPSPRFLAVGQDAVWVLNQGDGTVSRIDAHSNSVIATIEVGVPGPGGDIAVGEGFVWVTAVGKPLSRIDPRSNRLIAQFVGEGGDALRIGHGSVWLASFFLQEVWRVDPLS